MTRSTTEMRLIALPEFPLVEPGDDLAALIQASLARGSLFLEDGDLLVIVWSMDLFDFEKTATLELFDMY